MNDILTVKSGKRQLKFDRNQCISCAACVGTCPEEALDMYEIKLQVFEDKCTVCTLCARICPVSALSIEKIQESEGAK